MRVSQAKSTSYCCMAYLVTNPLLDSWPIILQYISHTILHILQIKSKRNCHLIDARNHGDSENHDKHDYLVILFSKSLLDRVWPWISRDTLMNKAFIKLPYWVKVWVERLPWHFPVFTLKWLTDWSALTRHLSTEICILISISRLISW